MLTISVMRAAVKLNVVDTQVTIEGWCINDVTAGVSMKLVGTGFIFGIDQSYLSSLLQRFTDPA